MNAYRHHVFFCCNQRDGGRACCADHGATQMRQYAKDRVVALGLSAEHEVRINQAGCLGRCEAGPVMVVYPEGTWYTYVDESDIDEIVEQHLVQHRVVTRLLA